MRLDKFIAQQLGVSRAIAGREIRGNRVTVDGEIVRNAAFKLLPEHDVAYDGNRWRSNTVHVTSCSISLRAMFAPRTTLITQRCSIFWMNR